MSFTESDRKVQPKSGKPLPDPANTPDSAFRMLIALAIREDYGDHPSSIKTVARLTRSNERAVRNWFEARNGPSGQNLVSLIQHSDAVLRAVLFLADRRTLNAAARLVGLRQGLVDLLTAIDNI